MSGLHRRLARHQRRRKRFHWHVDSLREAADNVVALPIRSSCPLEGELARTLATAYPAGPAGFGASDAHGTHLFYSAGDPLADATFHAILQRFRMRRPEEASPG